MSNQKASVEPMPVKLRLRLNTGHSFRQLGDEAIWLFDENDQPVCIFQKKDWPAIARFFGLAQ